MSPVVQTYFKSSRINLTFSPGFSEQKFCRSYFIATMATHYLHRASIMHSIVKFNSECKTENPVRTRRASKSVFNPF